MRFVIRPGEVLKGFLYFIFILLFLNIVGIIFRFYFDHDYIYGLNPLFNFDTEKNIPTFFSALALLFASFLLSLISKTHKRNGSAYRYWASSAAVFLFLSIDEITTLHEKLVIPSRELLNASGLFYYAWVIPYGIGLVVLLFIYFRFLMGLPKEIMRLFFISGTIFVTGAIGFELLEGRHAELNGKDNLLSAFYYTTEEFLEMLGVSLFIYALLLYMVKQFGSIAIAIAIEKSK